MVSVATAAGEEIRPSNTKGSRLFKHCQGSYSSIKNEKKNKLYLSPIISVLVSPSLCGEFKLKMKTGERVESKFGG